MATSDAPLSIGSVTLIVNDLDRMVEFYSSVLGLNEISTDGSVAAMGQGDAVLVKFVTDRQAKPYPREAGLHHTAFLLPDRAELGSWLTHVKKTGYKLDGAADHFVSEALYLSDPEGNSVEVYADRDRSEWTTINGQLKLGTERLDFASLQTAATGTWDALPEDSVIGHVHLQVGDVAQADSFYRDSLGLERMVAMGQASFYSSGGYHHHLAGNVWNSRGSVRKPVDATGLYEFELKFREPCPDAEEVNVKEFGDKEFGDKKLCVEKRGDKELDFKEIEDPWGVKIRFTRVPE